MRFDRAKEIVDSPGTIDVTYQGTSVWITDLDTSRQTAQVKLPADSNNIIEIPVTELIEHQLKK